MTKLDPITEEEWLLCNEYNREITNEFLFNSTQLSKQTVKAYKSNLMIWFNYVRDKLKNKPQTEIKSRDYMFYQNFLINMGHSSADIRNKRAAVSSLNNYIVLFYSDVYPTFKNFIVRGMPMPEKKRVHNKETLSIEEYNKLVTELEKTEDWEKVAWVKFSFDTGCRRAESRQILKNIIDYKPIIKQKKVENDDGSTYERKIIFYQTHDVRCKGSGSTGKIRKLRFSEDTMNALKRWMIIRGDDDCPFLFVSKNKVTCKQISESALNNWCSDIFSSILGCRVTPHKFRSARATSIVVDEGKDIKAAQLLLGHESSETTIQFYIIKDDDEEEVDDLF